MADFGADVIKVEPPRTGDPMRQWGQVQKNGRTLWWPVLARNKRCVTLDLRRAEGQAVARDLIQRADFVVENFRPRTMEKWGLGYDDVKADNPGLIMIRVSGFGQDGPYSHRPGYGSIGEAMGGLRYIVGDADRPPARVGISIGDTLSAMFACIGGLMALHQRERTGQGQVVDSALYESVLAVMESLITDFDQAGFVRERSGSILPRVAPSNVYPAGDGGMVLIAANQDSVFRRLCETMGEPGLADDPRYCDHAARGDRQRELDERIGRWTETLSTDELLAKLDEKDVPHGRIYTPADMLADAQFKAREAIVKVADPLFGDLRMQNVTPKLSETPGRIRWTGPDLGAHNREVYGDLLDYAPDRIAELESAGII